MFKDFNVNADSLFKGPGYAWCIFRHLYKGGNFFNCPFAFLYNKFFLIRVYSKRTEFAPLRVDSFSEESKHFERVQELPPMNVFPFVLIRFRMTRKLCFLDVTHHVPFKISTKNHQNIQGE